MVSVSLTKVSTCSFEKMPIYEVGFAVFPVAEEPCSERFRAFPKATQQEGAEPGFPPLAILTTLCSTPHCKSQLDLPTGRSGKARTFCGAWHKGLPYKC